MLNRLRAVIKNKNRVQREHKRRRVDEINEMRADSIFRAKLTADLQLVNILFMDPSIKNVVVETSPNNTARLDAAMYNSEMAEYSVQKDGQTYILSSQEVSF